MPFSVFRKHENKALGLFVICQFVQKYTYASQLATRISAQIAAWLNSYPGNVNFL